MPIRSDERYNWVRLRMHAIDVAEMRELIIDAWRMCVPAKVATAFLDAAARDADPQASLLAMPSLPSFTLQFDSRQIAGLASRYPAEYDAEIAGEIAPAVHARGYFTKPELVKVCEWKTPRSRPRVAANEEDDVREATRLALSTSSEALRIQIPMALSGISWPTASVLLHFGHRDRYPILDYRALEAFGIAGGVTYTLPFWTAYVAACRTIDDATGHGMRAIDRALWQWSKDRSRN